MEKEDFALISVIVPVYNVYDWLDRCMESIIHQTFTDFEVILINDGSTDGSEIKCGKWEEKDSRVRVISKRNEGPSIARNCGIRNAKGEYLVFIDADDWIECTYLEKLYNAIVEQKVAISECDVYRFNNDTGEKVYRCCSGNLGMQYNLEGHMKYGYTAIWKCMIKKSIFTDYGVEFPNCHSESRAIYPLLLAISGDIANVEEGLYYYRRFRKGSLSEKPRINDGDEKAIGLRAFDALVQGFKLCNLYDKYENLLQEIIKIKLSDLLSATFYRREKKDFLDLVENYYTYIGEKFPKSVNFKYINLGGYNLNRILCHMDLLHNPYGRFNFSSIISLMNPVTNQIQCIHKNKYREIMVKRDIISSFWEIIDEVKPEYIFVDFIEERFDIIEYLNGYITKSDAFEDAQLNLLDFRIIERDSEECLKLWQNSFYKFIEKIENKIPECKIVVIENYLSEQFGDINSRTYFENIKEIRKKNYTLKQCYDFVKENYKDIPTINASKCDYYFTDKEYEYGAIPSHLNEIVNQKIADKIKGEVLI